MPDYIEDPWAEQEVTPAPAQYAEPVLSGADYEDAPWALADEPDHVPTVEFDQQPVENERRDVVALIADDSGRAVALFRDPDEVQRMSKALGEALVEQVRTVANEAKAPRLAKHGPKHKPTEVTVAEELRTLADARDTLTAVARAITTGAEEARALAGEVLAEVAPDERKAKTIRLADGHGWDLKVVRSNPTEAVVELDQIQDVLAAWGLEQHAKDKGEHFTLGFARGQRYAMEALLSVLTKPGVKTTALDALVRELEGAGQEDLALRLSHAYGRRSTGEPRIEMKREAPKGGGSDAD